MNDLPKVYVQRQDKEIKNYQEEAIVNNKKDINYKEILSDDKYLFNHTYLIILNNNTQIKDSIISIKNNKILTIDNSWIDIDNIKDITEIKK